MVGWGVALAKGIVVGVAVAGNQSIVGVGVSVCVIVAVGEGGTESGSRPLHPDTKPKTARRIKLNLIWMIGLFPKRLIMFRS